MLGFDRKDNAILAALGRKEHNIMALARATRINRMTVTYRLARLRRLRLVEEKPAPGRQRLWGLSTGSTQRKHAVQIYYGSETMRAMVAFLKRTAKQSTIYTIEGLAYTQITNRSTSDSYEAREAIRLHQSYKRKHIILKSIIHPACVPNMRANSSDFLQARLNKPGLACISARVPGLDQACMYTFAPHGMLIANARKNYLIVITDPAVTQVIYTLMGVLYDSLDQTIRADQHSVHHMVERMLQG